MGRYYLSKKQEADSLRKLSVFFLREQGFFIPRSRKGGALTWTRHGVKNSIGILVSTFPEEMYAHLLYTQTDWDTGEERRFDYKVGLTTTTCHFGGVRFWFVCPLVTNGKYCGRRVGVLYKGGDYFGCRRCYNLTYRSRNEPKRFRDFPFVNLEAEWKADKLEEQLRRRFYAGRPTRKFRRVLKLRAKADGISVNDLLQYEYTLAAR